VYARATAAGGALLLALFASWRLFGRLLTKDAPAFDLLGVPMPTAALWAGGAFLSAALLICAVTAGVGTRIEGLDRRIRSLIDHLIDTQSEMAKVAWPSRDQLTRSTVAVLVSIVLLGAFLFCVDWVLGSLHHMLFLVRGS